MTLSNQGQHDTMPTGEMGKISALYSVIYNVNRNPYKRVSLLNSHSAAPCNSSINYDDLDNADHQVFMVPNKKRNSKSTQQTTPKCQPRKHKTALCCEKKEDEDIENGRPGTSSKKNKKIKKTKIDTNPKISKRKLFEQDSSEDEDIENGRPGTSSQKNNKKMKKGAKMNKLMPIKRIVRKNYEEYKDSDNSDWKNDEDDEDYLEPVDDWKENDSEILLKTVQGKLDSLMHLITSTWADLDA
ncbi:unnamed protein product [Caenorhabditis nigoni]